MLHLGSRSEADVRAYVVINQLQDKRLSMLHCQIVNTVIYDSQTPQLGSNSVS